MNINILIRAALRLYLKGSVFLCLQERLSLSGYYMTCIAGNVVINYITSDKWSNKVKLRTKMRTDEAGNCGLTDI